MVRIGDEFSNAASGERYVFRQTGTETGGALVVLEDYLGPGTEGPQAHVHPRQEERFIVRSGLLGVRIGDREHVLAAGEAIAAAPGVAHKIRNAGDDDLHITVEMRPALRFAQFLAAAAALTHGEGGAGRRFNLLEGALLMREYGDEIRPAWPAPRVQRVAFPILAIVGRVFGYRLVPLPRATVLR